MARSRHAAKVLPLAALVFALALAGTGTAHAAFPGENGRIAFQSGFDVYSMNPDGARQTRLTCRVGGWAWRTPAWSADGERIAFGLDRTIWTMNADGADQMRLGPPRKFGPAWSPDRGRIAFSVSFGDRLFPPGIAIRVMDASGNVLGTLAENASGGPAWSPDGERIAFSGISVINADGSDRTHITPGGSPNWSPDGQRLAFDNDGDIWTVNADGSDLTRLTHSGFEPAEQSPAWSPDGERIAFARGTRWDISAVPDERYPDIWIMDRDGTNQVNLTQSPTYDTEPEWQPLRPGTELGPPPSQFCFEALRRNTKRGIARLLVEVPRPGRVVLERRPGVRRAVRVHQGEGKGRVALPVRPRGKARQRLNRKAKRAGRARARLPAQVTYNPRLGERRTKGRRVWLVQR